MSQNSQMFSQTFSQMLSQMVQMRAPFVIPLVVATALAFATQAGAETEPFGDPPPADASAEAVVDGLHDALIASMRAGDSLDTAERQRALRPVVERVFNFPRMSRFIFGRTWSQMDAGERERFADAFVELTLTNYAERFTGYDDQRFEAVGIEPMGDNRAHVERRFLRAQKEAIPFEYLLERDDDGTWRIINVIVDGVSDLALRRSLYTEAYADGGIDAVIEEMEGTTGSLAES